jgi:DNA-binding NarL/FixJ family response regulator
MAVCALAEKGREVKFLIIDDHENIRMVLALGLKLIFGDPQIDDVATVNDAIHRLSNYKYDVVISDFDLEQGGVGIDVDAFLKRTGRKEKFVLFSSRPPTNYCGAMLNKPYRLSDIRDLKEYLDENKSRK